MLFLHDGVFAPNTPATNLITNNDDEISGLVGTKITLVPPTSAPEPGCLALLGLVPLPAFGHAPES